MFSQQLPWKTLAIICRSLSTLLDSGVELLKALRVTGGKAARPRVQAVFSEMSDGLREGKTIAEVMREQDRHLPELLIDMAAVGEQTGNLPEVLSRLAEHYENMVRLWNTFIGAIIWPVFEFVSALLIVALVILVLGLITPANGTPYDPIGLGLSGVNGALTWLGYWAMGLVGAVLAYQLLIRGFGQQSAVHGLLMRIPVVGHCMRSFALARFAWAFSLTQQSGMPIEPSLIASFRATGNGAFLGAAPRVVSLVNEGEELSLALAETHLFPGDFIEIVSVGEAAGTVPEMLERISPNLEEDARRALMALSAMAGWGVFLLVAIFIIVIIFRIMMTYINMLNSFGAEALK